MENEHNLMGSERQPAGSNSKLDQISPQKHNSQGDVDHPIRTVTKKRSAIIKSQKSLREQGQLNMSLKKRINLFLEGTNYMIFMTIVTLYALFGDDVRQLSTDKDGDEGFWIVTLICMGFFALEIIFSSLCKDGYFFGFFFWLDILSTVSMILDVGWISDAMFGSSGGAAINAVQLARAGRASKIGTRAGRIVRVVRLIRLSKLYKHAKQSLEREAEKLLAEEIQEDNLLENNQSQELALNGQENQSSQRSEDSIDQNLRQHQSQNVPITDQQVAKVQPRTSVILQHQNSNADQEGQQQRFVRRQTRKLQLSSQVIRSQTNIHNNKRASIATPLGRQRVSKSDDEELHETNIGKELNELTNKRVITIVMLIMFSIPILNLSTYRDENLSFSTGLGAIQFWAKDTEIYQNLIKEFINYHQDLRDPLLLLNINGTDYWPFVNTQEYENYREVSLNYFTSTDSNGNSLVSIQYTNEDDDLNAILSIVRTFFVSIVLSVAAVMFSKDVQDLILTPVEKMLETVNKIAENPLVAAQEEENKAFIQQNEDGNMKKLEDEEDDKLETVILQKLIVKVGTLLALGFGEAGSQIIAQNMGANDSINPMLPGKKIMAIFGFCDIRNFTDATEVLQQDVMVFVNEIAEIVHGIVDQFSGSANKNIGDAFLLVWKFAENDYYENSDGKLELKLYEYVLQTADMAILSFVTIITNITLSQKLQKYKQHEGLNQRIPNYSVKMGFGLHVGWAIEGAIGSSYKIDASYLSPNVNMASRLEAATKQFGSMILISGQLRNIATKATQRNLRLIDRVTVKGSIEPIDLYTVDLNVDGLLRRPMKKKTIINAEKKNYIQPNTNDLLKAKKKQKVLRRMKRDRLKQAVIKNNIQIADVWRKDSHIKMARQLFNKEFYSKWNQGFQYYIQGDWDKAKQIFEQTLNFLPNYRDGPSNTLIRVITEDSYLRNNWKGYRELTEK